MREIIYVDKRKKEKRRKPSVCLSFFFLTSLKRKSRQLPPSQHSCSETRSKCSTGAFCRLRRRSLPTFLRKCYAFTNQVFLPCKKTWPLATPIGSALGHLHCTFAGIIWENSAIKASQPLRACLGFFVLTKLKQKSRQLPTFPQKCSIIGVRELDFRVRYGNGYCLSTMATGIY